MDFNFKEKETIIAALSEYVKKTERAAQRFYKKSEDGKAQQAEKEAAAANKLLFEFCAAL